MAEQSEDGCRYDLADESLFDDEEPLTRPGVARPSAPPPRATKKKTPKPRLRVAKDPDSEAHEIVEKVADRIAVSGSLARIASSVVRSFADRKMAEIVESDAANAIAYVERARRLAIAAKEAAAHAASLAAKRAAARAEEMSRTDR
jgi:hypothetical protein